MNKVNGFDKFEKLIMQGTTPINSDNYTDKYKFYSLNKTGQIICEYRIRLGLKNGPINIAQITDVHLNFCLEENFEDEEVNYTRQCRTWLANGEAAEPLKKSMDVASYFDQTVVTGDILDYLSNGSKQLAQKYIFERDPEVICTIGSHDITKQMQTGIDNKLPEEQRLNIIQEFWPNNIFYVSKILNDEIIIIGMNTAYNKYYPSQIQKLKSDIKSARDEGKYILIFQHDPLCTGNPNDNNIEPILSVGGSNSKPRNFYDGCIGNSQCSDDVTQEVYKIITHSSDVIKGLFCGHLHSCFFTEILSFDNDGKKNVIPQINALGNPYFSKVGVLTRIIIE